MTRLEPVALCDAGISETYDLQEYIFNSPDEFCQELGQELEILNKEVRINGDRIDLLALDNDGNAVIIELKRGSHKLQLLQAIGYAGMIAKWSVEECKVIAKDPKVIDEFGEQLNENQRILLVAEEYDFEVLAGAEWLYAKGVEIDCVRVALAVDGIAEFLTFTQIFPTPELAEQARRKHTKSVTVVNGSWEDAFGQVDNEAVLEFFKRHLNSGKANKLRYREVAFAGDYHVYLKKRFACVECWNTRSSNDIEFWRSRLSNPDSVRTYSRSQSDDSLRFRLFTASDVTAFETVVEHGLPTEVLTSAASA